VKTEGPTKNYWSNRNTSSKFNFEQLKNNPLLAWIFSCRSADAFYIKKLLLSRPKSVVLDVGCGSGKKQLVQFSSKVYGVDIPGFPSKQTLQKGYAGVQEWEKPDYLIRLPEKVDIVFVINVNAHVEWDLFKIMLINALENAKNKALIVFINEYDNDCEMYKIMKKTPNRFKEYVHGLEHWYFIYESLFLEKITSEFPCWQYLGREELVRNPSISHYIAFRWRSNVTTTIAKFGCLLLDVLISIYNNIQKAFGSSDNKSFLVAHAFEVRRTL